MPRKKVDTIKSPRNLRKNISLTLQNEEKEEKSNSTVKKKKQCVPRSRRKAVNNVPTNVANESVQQIVSPAASKKTRKKVSTTKSPHISKKINLLTERNTNVSNAKSHTTVKTKKISVRRSSRKKETAGSSAVVVPFQFAASPVASCSKNPRKKIITTKSPRSLKKRNILPERNLNENKEKCECTVKTKKPRGICKKCGIRKVAVPSLVLPPLQYVEELASLTASSSKKTQRKVLKTKRPLTSRKRRLPIEQMDQENNENNSNIKKKKLCDSQLKDREDNVPPVVNISSTEDVASLKEIASAAVLSVEQKDHGIIEESDRNMNNQKHCDLQSAEIEDDEPFVVHVSPAKDVAFVKEIAPSVNSQSHYKKIRETRCMICLELEESSVVTIIPCGHCFHSLCLQTWFEVKETCPVCNPEISANGDASNNSGIDDTVKCNDMNRCVDIFDCVEKGKNELHHIDRGVNDMKKLNEDINEFLMRCVICMGTSKSLPLVDSHNQFAEFELMPCGHNVHIACAQTSSGVKEVCPVCTENSRIEDDSIYEFPEEVRCAICLDTVESSNFEYISCYHSFHHQCIQTWFTVRRGEICPVCMVSCSSNAVEDEDPYGFLENVKCTICMDIDESSEFQRLSCRHSFHTMCAQTWFQENNYCPTCMRNISLGTDDEEDVRCVICVDTEESSVFEFLSCCHSFHAACIQSWLKKGKSCPICNTRILDTSNAVENVTCAEACN